MKRLIFILLCLPFFLFSQEKKIYTKTISITEFVKDLKLAAEQKKDYTLENCAIIYNEKADKEYVHIQNSKWHGTLKSAIINENISFPKGSSVTLSNCAFNPHGFVNLAIKNIKFWNLYLININSFLELDSINVRGKLDIKYGKKIDKVTCSIKNSNINSINYSLADSLYLKEDENIHGLALTYNRIKYCNINSAGDISIAGNHIAYLSLSGKILFAGIQSNQFYIDFRNTNNIHQKSDHKININVLAGINIVEAKIRDLAVTKNKSIKIKQLTNDSLIRIINRIKDSLNVKVRSYMMFSKNGNNGETYMFNELIENKSMMHLEASNTLILKEQLDILEQLNEKNDSLQIIHTKSPEIIIQFSEFETLNVYTDTFSLISISSNTIKDEISLHSLSVDSSFFFYKNKLPDVERINIDKTSFDNLSFNYNNKSYYGNEEFSDVKDIYNNKKYLSGLDKLIMIHRQFINILDTQGKGAKKIGILKLKDLETTKKMYDYYNDTKTENWFNWKGSIFLKWYSDHGTNPFKALSYCFWVVIYFSLFYFIFYNDWDKIDRKFLIKRFNSAMDYFTTEKRIEDFYSTTHDKEMTTFTEFKETLENNKVHMPSMLNSLAKPIYQISLFRYKLLSFFYKKAEFMAGRKWLDLKKKDRYLIGTLTFFLTISYIIYLISIRALNSLTLSINAFSTLGFGQIPVRGFTKYFAIIEGFIGWFLLSIFLVSILNQMMSV